MNNKNEYVYISIPSFLGVLLYWERFIRTGDFQCAHLPVVSLTVSGAWKLSRHAQLFYQWRTPLVLLAAS